MSDWTIRTTRRPTTFRSGPLPGGGPPCQPGSICSGLRALVLVVAATACHIQEPDTIPQQRSALEAIYDATGGGDWYSRDNWLSDRPLDDWYGVSTNADGYVDSINLHGNGLSGPIPAELGNLANLEILWLNGTGVSGPIPAELGNLANLKELFSHAAGLWWVPFRQS